MLPGLTSLAGLSQGGTAGSFDVDISAETISKTGSTSGGPKTLTTNSVFVTPHGGTGPYTYAWTHDGGTPISATAPTSSATNFTATCAANDYFLDNFICTVTDSTGANASAFVSVAISLVGP
jgi:hypothetical protein